VKSHNPDKSVMQTKETNNPPHPQKHPTTNIPPLRFPGFEGEWVEKKLGDISNVTSGGTPNRSKLEYWNGNIPWVTTSLINFNEIEQTEENITELGLKNSSAKLFPIGTILIAMYGQGMTRGKVAKLNIQSTTNQACAAILLESNLETNFVFQYLSNKYEDIRSLSNEGGQKNLSGTLIKTIKLSIPTLPEQKKIATFLTAVDRRIQLLTQKKAKLEQYKKGVMQGLFATPQPSGLGGEGLADDRIPATQNPEIHPSKKSKSSQLRFKDENGNDFPDWEERKLGEVAKIKTGSSNRKDSDLDGEYTFFDRSDDIRKSSIYLFDAEAVIIPGEGQDFIPKYFVGKFDLHQRTYAVMEFNSLIAKYLLYFLSFDRKYLLSQAVGSTVKSLRLPMFIKMPISLPTLPEQKKIATFLSSIDEKIEKVGVQIEKMQAWKKGLLQQMFV